MPRGFTPQEIAGLIKGFMNNHCPLIKPAIRAGYYFLEGFPRGIGGGGGPLTVGSHDLDETNHGFSV